MYEHLSRRVDHVIKLANNIAREFEQEYVGTEHVLLAIAREGGGMGAASWVSTAQPKTGSPSRSGS